MRYVYLLQSQSDPDQQYIGVTGDLRERLQDHNAGRARHSSKFAPWTLIRYVASAHDPAALKFEKYLKSGSGRAFAKRYLV